MKAKIIREDTLHAPTLKEGDVVDIVPGMETDAEGIWNAPAGKLFLCKKSDGTLVYTQPSNLKIIYDYEDERKWLEFREETAKSALCAILSNPATINNSYESVCNLAINFADELVKQLK